MSAQVYAWLLGAHLIGVFLWIGGLMTVYWMLRVHTQTPPNIHEKLVLMERALAMTMDLGATLAIGAGLAMAIGAKLFSDKHYGWLHIKLAVVVLGVLSVHGIVRARVGRFSRGEMKPVPSWAWSVLLASLVAILILVTRVKLAYNMP
ncbi:MAG TPA: CopD family protein [Kofleriaceae bacterium]|nr:CopD family protein [Kofleriaceae bacterium]